MYHIIYGLLGIYFIFLLVSNQMKGRMYRRKNHVRPVRAICLKIEMVWYEAEYIQGVC